MKCKIHNVNIMISDGTSRIEMDRLVINHEILNTSYYIKLMILIKQILHAMNR